MPQWLLAVKMAIGKLLVHKDDVRSSRIVGLRERAAMQEGNARDTEVIGGYDRIERGKPLLARHFRAAPDLQWNLTGPSCRQVRSNSDGFRAWNALKAWNQVLNEQALLRSVLISRIVKGDACREKIFRLKAQILMLNLVNPTEEQAGSDH